MTHTERNRLACNLWCALVARTAHPTYVDMATPAMDAAGCLDAPDAMPAGSMMSAPAWTFPRLIEREAHA